MIFQNDQVTLLVLSVDAARHVGDIERFDAQQVHQSYGVGNLRHAVAFVGVKAALHGYHRLLTQRSVE